jgi:hypothetical protein
MILCAVLDCRRTGRPTFGRSVFVCTKHIGDCCTEAAIRDYTECAGDRRAAEMRAARGGRDTIARHQFLEANSWDRLMNQVKAKKEIRPGVEL